MGTAAVLVLTSLHARARSFAYAVMVSPLLTPGVVIGISTLILWRQVGVGGGIALIVVAQTTFIICYVMLMVMARSGGAGARGISAFAMTWAMLANTERKKGQVR